jgi:hypothetical protein
MDGVANPQIPEWNRILARRVRGTILKFSTVAVFHGLFGLFSSCQQLGPPPPATATNASPQPQKPEGPPRQHKLGPLDVAANWRVRVEGWNWFEANSGDNDYGFAHSLLRISVGQQTEHFDWKLEGTQDSILGLPSNAIVGAPQGQLGLGGTYYASNGNTRNNANGFVKQAYVTLKGLGPFNAQLGRFEFLDGIEKLPKNKLLAALAQSRVSQRLIGNFGWSAVGRSFDGGRLTADWDSGNVTFVAARPTRGVYQVDGMGELDINLFYGAYTHVFTAKGYTARLRSFGIGYFDQRNSVLKTDNRPAAVRGGDHDDLQIGTFGGEFLQVFDVNQHNKIDVILWGVTQTGSWGIQSHRASAFITEVGWQAGSIPFKPWISLGLSQGSGDKNPNNGTHNTFFQLLPTPRPYARFPFFNMQNNDDFYASAVLQPASKLSFRSELHALRLGSGTDLWYLGGGAFQPRTSGYTGRPTNGNRSLANVWDLSGDYQVTKMFAVGLYYGHAWGKSVIQSIYPKNANGQMAYVETNVRF